MSAQQQFKVLVTHPEIPEAALQLLKRECEVIVCSANPPKRSEILSKCSGVDGIFWGTHDKLDSEALNIIGPTLKVVSTMSAGLDHVDVPELQRRGIKLGHTPVVLSKAVAELAIGLMIAASRRFHEGREKIEKNQWENWHHNWMLGQEIGNSTIGFIGFGSIGQAIAKRLQGFEINKILYYTRQISPNAEKFNAVHVTYEQVLKESDFLFITCPLTSETKEMLNEAAFNQMKSTSVLINIARGGIVKQDDLYKVLREEKIFAAGLDVTTPEPLPNNDPLLSLPNCVTIPHLGSATYKTRENMGILAATNIINGLKGLPLVYSAY